MRSAIVAIDADLFCIGLFSLYGVEGSTNVQGEVVKKLDVVANDAFITALNRSNIVRIMVSEENTDPIVVSDAHGKFTKLWEKPTVCSSSGSLFVDHCCSSTRSLCGCV